MQKPNETLDEKAKKEERFPLNIPESQGDVADRAESQIQADIAEQIERARRGLSTRREQFRPQEHRDL